MNRYDITYEPYNGNYPWRRIKQYMCCFCVNIATIPLIIYIVYYSKFNFIDDTMGDDAMLYIVLTCLTAVFIVCLFFTAMYQCICMCQLCLFVEEPHPPPTRFQYLIV